jgi:nucleoside-diphosphate-sugar epimerase
MIANANWNMAMLERKPPLRLCVIGATGFVGRALIARMHTRRNSVIAAHALVRGDRARLCATGVRTISGALGDASLPRELFFSEPHVLVHLATKVHDDGRGLRENAAHAAQLVQHLTPQCRGILYASCGSVYGQGSKVGVDERAELRPGTALAQSHWVTEQLLTQAARERGISALMLRPGFVVGHGDRQFLPRMQRLLQRGIGVGSGQQAFTIVDVHDYAEMMLRLAYQMLEAPRPCVRALNVGYAAPIQFQQLAEIMGMRPRAFVPVLKPLTALLRKYAFGRLRRIATNLERMGLSHHLDVGALARILGGELVGRDPRSAIASAAAAL